MIKENQKLFNRLNIFTDAAAAFVSVVAAYLIVFNLLDFERNYPLQDYFKLLLIFVPVQLLTYACMGLYDSFRSKRFSTELGRLFGAFLLDGLLLIALLYVAHFMNFSRWALAIFLGLDFLIVALKRFVMRNLLRKFRKSGYNKKYVLIVGSGAAARDYLSTIRRERHFGYECAGYVSDGELEGAKKLGGLGSLLRILEDRSYDEVICALDASDDDKLSSVVEACELTGTKISVIPSIYKYMSATPAIDVVGNIPIMNIRRIPLDNVGNALLKRAADIVGAALLLIITSPIVLVSMLVIKATMGGEVIFKQKRVGYNKKVFTMYKLKSMKDSDESDTAWSKETDPRRTKFGAFIRKFSIDELPQLVNVIKGDMSLVGPRPEIPFYVKDFKDKIPMYMIRHQVKPGITGLAQINGYRGDTSIEKRIDFDVQYIENWSPFLDISILLKTALSGFVNKEKLSADKKEKAPKPYRAEKYNMNKKEKTDLLAAAMLLPSIVAVALIPIIMHVSKTVTTLKDTYRLFGGTVNSTDSGTEYVLIDSYSQGKGLAIAVIAVIMLGVALVCCMSLFRRIEKRSLVYVGCSVLFVVMSLISAVNSEYQSIAFNGVYDRAEGFWTLACYFVMFLFTMYAFKTAGNFKFISIALFIAVGINFVMAVFQFTGNNLLGKEWFKSLILDKSLIGYDLEFSSSGSNPYGALYNPNYVGSFGGLIIPLFTVMAIYTDKKLWRALYIVFDALAVTFLVMSTARSGIVAVAAAFVVGIIVFARQIGKHRKLCISLVAGAAVCVVGLNFALGNKLFARIPSLVNDVIGLFLPADEEDKDLYSKLPLREINIPSEGAIEFTGQGETMYMGYDAEKSDFTFTNENGDVIPSYTVITLEDTGFSALQITADYANKSVTVAAGELSVPLTILDDGSLAVDETREYTQSSSGDTVEIGALGVAEMNISGNTIYMEYDSQYGRLFFTDTDDNEAAQNEIICFSDETFKDVRFWVLDLDSNSVTRDVFSMSFYGDTTNSLFFQMVKDNKFQMLHYRTADKFDPVNADYIGFEGKEKVGSSRGYIWSRTLPLLKNCLITGYGADTFAYYFPQNDVLAKYYSYQEYGQGFYVTVDKPHNMYLQIFCNDGLIALIAFLAIMVFYLVDSLRLYALRREYRREQIMGAAVMLGIVGYLAAGFFNDSVVHVAPVFWVLLGVGAALNTINRRADRNIAVDEDYVPIKEKPQATPEQTAKHEETVQAGQILAALIRDSQSKKPERTEHKYSKEDISSLLESVRAMRSGSAQPDSTEEAGGENYTAQMAESDGDDDDNS